MLNTGRLLRVSGLIEFSWLLRMRFLSFSAPGVSASDITTFLHESPEKQKKMQRMVDGALPQYNAALC